VKRTIVAIMVLLARFISEISTLLRFANVCKIDRNKQRN